MAQRNWAGNEEELTGEDRYLAPSPGKVSAYAVAREKSKKKEAKKAAAKAAVPAPETVTGPNPGETQPSLMMDDPFLQPGLSTPAGITAPMNAYGRPGSFDKRGAKMGQAQGREKSLAVYKTPGEYYSQLDTVLGSPVMKNLSEGLERYKGLREDFLKNAPAQTDLSSLMGLADFISRKPGKALASYKRPDDYNDLVSKLAGLMGQEQSAAYNQAQLAMNQVPLKAGEEGASMKTEVGQEADRGFSVPRPASRGAGMMNPLNQALAIQRSFQGLRPYKEAEEMLSSAQGMIQTLAKPNWVADKELRGQMLQAMQLSPISEKEMKEFGSGDPSLLNRIRNMVGTGLKGRSLNPQDYKALEAFARAKADYAQKKMGMVQDQFVSGLGPYAPAFSSEGIRGLTQPAIPPSVGGQGDQGDQVESDQMKLLREVWGN